MKQNEIDIKLREILDTYTRDNLVSYLVDIMPKEAAMEIIQNYESVMEA